MDKRFKDALLNCETDLGEALHRLSGDEAIYEKCLAMFLEDQNAHELELAMNTQAWDAAFAAVHALKGIAANMGFLPLYRASSQMVLQIRAGQTDEARASYEALKHRYDEISTVIRRYIQ